MTKEIVKYTEKLRVQMKSGEVFFVDARAVKQIQKLANDNKLIELEGVYRRGWDIEKMDVVKEIDGYDLLSPSQRTELEERIVKYRKAINKKPSDETRAKWIRKLLNGANI